MERKVRSLDVSSGVFSALPEAIEAVGVELREISVDPLAEPGVEGAGVLWALVYFSDIGVEVMVRGSVLYCRSASGEFVSRHSGLLAATSNLLLE